MGQSIVRDIAGAASVPVESIGRLEVLAARSAPAFIEGSAAWAQHRIVAIEGFRALAGGAYEPAMDWILDLSSIADPAVCREEARSFVDDAPNDLLFAFDVEQLPDLRT